MISQLSQSSGRGWWPPLDPGWQFYILERQIWQRNMITQARAATKLRKLRMANSVPKLKNRVSPSLSMLCVHEVSSLTSKGTNVKSQTVPSSAVSQRVGSSLSQHPPTYSQEQVAVSGCSEYAKSMQTLVRTQSTQHFPELVDTVPSEFNVPTHTPELDSQSDSEVEEVIVYLYGLKLSPVVGSRGSHPTFTFDAPLQSDCPAT